MAPILAPVWTNVAAFPRARNTYGHTKSEKMKTEGPPKEPFGALGAPGPILEAKWLSASN